MIETVLGVALVALGVWVAPQGCLAYRGLVAFGGLVGLFAGVQVASTAPLFAEPFGLPLLHALLGLVAVGGLVVLGSVVGLGALPFAIGYQAGQATFDNWLLAMGTGTVLVGVTVVVVIVALWLAVGLAGGAVTAAGVQLLTGVGPRGESVVAAAAERLPEPLAGTVVEAVVTALGAVTASALLSGIAVVVGVAAAVWSLLAE